MEELDTICCAKTFYKTPFKEQWKAQEEKITNSLLLAENTENVYYLVYYLNILTNKTTGIIAKCPNNMDYIIKKFSYKDLPMYVLEYTHNKEETITCFRCFAKTEGGTCINQGRTFNTTVNKDIIFQDYGLNFGNIH